MRELPSSPPVSNEEVVLLSRIAEFARIHGGSRIGACLFCKALFALLRLVFRFDPWHSSAPYPCREYKVQTAALANSLKPKVVIDIGCGFGEVLTHIGSAKRFGIDRDPQILRAARFLNGSKVSFRQASVSDSPALASAIGNVEVDLLIMTNWHHGTPLPVLIETVKDLARSIGYKYLILDTVRPGTLADAVCHSLDDIRHFGPVLRSVSGGDGIRDLHVLGPPSDLVV